MYVQDILGRISKVPFEIPYKISYTYTEWYVVHSEGETLRALRLKSSVFLKWSPGHQDYFSSSNKISTKKTSTRSITNVPPLPLRHLLPDVLQIMHRNTKYEQFN